ARQAFDYYAPHYGLTNNDVYGIKSRNDMTGYAKDLDQLRGHQRVWIVISHPFYIDEEGYILQYMAQFATRCTSFAQQAPTSPVASFGTRAAAYLFDTTGVCNL